MVLRKAFEHPDLAVATLGDVVTSSDQRELIGWIRHSIERAGAARVLVVLERFNGWRPASLDDPGLWLRDDERVSKIAIVGEMAWRSTILTLIAQPLRRIPIEYFETEAAARQWLETEAEASTNVRST